MNFERIRMVRMVRMVRSLADRTFQLCQEPRHAAVAAAVEVAVEGVEELALLLALVRLEGGDERCNGPPTPPRRTPPGSPISRTSEGSPSAVSRPIRRILKGFFRIFGGSRSFAQVCTFLISESAKKWS